MLLSTTGSMASTLGVHNPLRYRGYVYDNETALYYLQSRYYDPDVGRFINADAFASTGQGILGNNMFAYCNNNPVIRVDYDGRAFDVIFDIGFVCWDIYHLSTNDGYKDWRNWAALGTDILFAALPVASGGGQIVKLSNIGDAVTNFSKVTVIGETMTRVETVSQFVNATDNLYDGFKGYKKLSESSKVGKVLAEIIGKTSNIAWLYNKVRQGYTIVDIGIDVGRTIRSSSYVAESIFMRVWKYRNALKLSYHIKEE